MSHLLGLGAIVAAVVVAGCTSPSNPPAAAENTGVAAAIGKDLAATYTSQPYGGGQQTPAHVWLQEPDGELLFFHLNNDDVTKATGVLFTGDAVPGRLCKGAGGVSQAQLDAGYVHFHSKSAPNWDAGHNNAGDYAETSKEGYWLRHLGATDGSMTMGGQSMPIQRGQVFPLMPADLAKLQPCAAMTG